MTTGVPSRLAPASQNAHYLIGELQELPRDHRNSGEEEEEEEDNSSYVLYERATSSDGPEDLFRLRRVLSKQILASLQSSFILERAEGLGDFPRSIEHECASLASEAFRSLGFALAHDSPEVFSRALLSDISDSRSIGCGVNSELEYYRFGELEERFKSLVTMSVRSRFPKCIETVLDRCRAE